MICFLVIEKLISIFWILLAMRNENSEIGNWFGKISARKTLLIDLSTVTTVTTWTLTRSRLVTQQVLVEVDSTAHVHAHEW